MVSRKPVCPSLTSVTEKTIEGDGEDLREEKMVFVRAAAAAAPIVRGLRAAATTGDECERIM